MALDHYTTLGRSGLRVSPLCLGAMTFGTEWGFGTGPDESIAQLERYIGRGGNFIDTANIYTKGHSEAILGEWLASGGGKGLRDRLVIATKFGGGMHVGDPNGGGSGRKAIMHQVEDSLRRLRTDHIDLLWVHFLDPHTPVDETVHTLDMLVRAGKVRYLGLSDHPAWVCTQMQYEAILKGWVPFVALQIEYSLLQRTVEGELMPMARALGLSTRVRSDSTYLNETTFAIVDALREIGSGHGATPAQVALRWVMDRAGVTSTILGARTMAQLEDNLGACTLRLSAEETARCARRPSRATPASTGSNRRCGTWRRRMHPSAGRRAGGSPRGIAGSRAIAPESPARL
ncbi:MAG: hypothetical protein RLZZ217_671 [Planctomycetota bacterium]